MSIFQTPVQSAIFSRLTNQVNSATVYDDVPGLPEGLPDSGFPYIVVGEDAVTDWDTDNTLGGNALVTLHVWSRYQGKKEVKEIMGEIYDALHRQAANLSAAGYTFIDCLFQNDFVIDEGDGVTRHGVCRYTVTLEKE